MDEPGGEARGDESEIERMQSGVREWLLRARHRRYRLRELSPPALLSLLCAAAFCPFITDGSAVASVTVLSSIGGNLLSGVLKAAVDRVRGQQRTLDDAEIEDAIAREVREALSPDAPNVAALSAEIGIVLKRIDVSSIMLEAAIAAESEQVRGEVIAAISVLDSGFTELGFRISDLMEVATGIRGGLDEQGIYVRAMFEHNARESARIRRTLEELAALERPARADNVGTGSSQKWHGNPYRGLLPFSEADADVFYGRERQITDLAVLVAAKANRGGLIVVTGASGAGKSSLLQAGLVPALARGLQVAGSNRWPCLIMTPTGDPLTELAARLSALGGIDPASIKNQLDQDPGQAYLNARQALLADALRHRWPTGDSLGGSRLLLIVDQFEELFTLSPGSGALADPKPFLVALSSMAAGATSADGSNAPAAVVIIAVRGDFCDRCAVYPELARAMQDGTFVVGPMTESELRVAITGPADAAGLIIDRALTDTILGDLRAVGSDDTSGVLPLLSQAMTLTWEQREGDQLTSHGYGRAGGIRHAVQTGAEKAYDALTAGQKELTRDIFRRMTVVSRDGRIARRSVIRSDLYRGLQKARQTDIDAVLDAFANERLMILDDDTIQISHDILLRAWPRLLAWLEQDQASWVLYGQLADTSAAWHDSRNDPSFLYRGTPLTVLQEAIMLWSENPERYPALTDTQRDFLHASERAAARTSWQKRAAVLLLALLAVVASIASIFASQARNTAVQQRDQAIRNQVIAEALQYSTSDITLAAQLELAAYHIQPTQDLASRLLNTENTPLSHSFGSGGDVNSVAFSPDSNTLVSGTDNGTFRLWDVADPAHSSPFGQPLIGGGGTSNVSNFVALSPDGRILASGGSDGVISLWDVINPAHPRRLGKPLVSSSVNAVAFSYDSHTLVSGSDNGTFRLWDVADPAHPLPLGQIPTASSSDEIEVSATVAFSPDGHTLVSSNFDGTASLWDVSDPAHPRSLGKSLTSGGNAEIETVAFSPNGHTLATGDSSGTIRLWDLTDPAAPRSFGQPLTNTSRINAVAFSHDSRTLASGNEDGTIRLWNVTDPAHPQSLGQPLTSGSDDSVYALTFSQDGHSLASGYRGGAIRLWSLPATLLANASGAVNAVAFSPDGRILADGNNDGTIWLWNVTDPSHPRPLGKPLASGSAVNAVAFSHDSRTLASGYSNGAVRLWDLTDPAHARSLGKSLTSGGNAEIETLAFSPEGHILASGDSGGTVRLWNLTVPALARQFGKVLTSNAEVQAVAFSPNGRTLARGNAAGAILLWDVSDPARPRQLGPPLTSDSSNSITAVAFSPNGHTLASGSLGGTAKLWDVTDPVHPRSLGQPLTSSSSVSVNAVAFSQDSRTLASGNNDGTTELWDVSNPVHPQPLGQALASSSGDNVIAVAFSPRGDTLASADTDGITELWNLNVHEAIERICNAAGNLTRPEQHKYIPQYSYQPACDG